MKSGPVTFLGGGSWTGSGQNRSGLVGRDTMIYRAQTEKYPVRTLRGSKKTGWVRAHLDGDGHLAVAPSPPAPCMLKKGQSAHLMGTAVGKLAKRSGARFATAAGGRSSALRSKKTVGELDRRRSHEISPNSRQSRRGASRRSSSHSQGRDIVMDVAFKSVVGIDIAKRTLDVHVLPERTSLKQPNDSKGRGQLREKLPAPGECLIVVEATGGYERALVAELIDAGHQVAVVNPRQVRDFAKACGILARDRSHRRGRVGTLRAGRRAAHPDQNPGKTARTARSRRPTSTARRAANRRNEPQGKRRQQVR